MEFETIFQQNHIKVEQNEDQLLCTNGSIQMVYHIKDGTADIYDIYKHFKLTNIVAKVKLDNKEELDSSHFNKDYTNVISVEEQRDNFGNGMKLSIKDSREDGLCISQNFYLYKEQEYILMQAEILAEKAIKSNYIAPFSARQLECSGDGDFRFLFTPFDNDDFVRYAALPFNEAAESYEVTSVFDNNSRRGMVIGSVSHDTWKTGIQVKQGEQSLSDFTVFGGITSRQTRDTLPHGFVEGKTIASPKIFLGFYDDYRDGMEAYGSANAIIAPPLAWDKGIPMGWNSWSAVAGNIDYDIYVNSSDFVKEHLQHNSFSADGVVYINFDACWGKLSEEQLIKAAEHVKNNGQVPGIYTTPFTFWGGKETKGIVGGTNEKYCWEDMLLKDEQGNILPPLDTGFSIDPTHPGNHMRLIHEFQKFKEWGFQYVKMDFMSHGAVEGVHYNKDITTGIAAYNYGMQQIVDILKDEIEKQEFFISLSIAPIFPAQYAHSRRVSCDVFGTINWAEYMLNSLTYGWWLNDKVYRFNDPDHIVVYNSYNHLDEIMFHEGLTRYISSAIAGTMMIDSDDFRIEEARNRTKEILTNEEINQVAKAGISFRPVEGNTKDRACDCFMRYDEEEQVTYLAVFNFSNIEKKDMEIDTARIGLDQNENYVMYDLWSKTSIKICSKIAVTLEEAEPKLFKISKQ